MTTTETPLDGRRQRRDRNREAVVEALLALYREDNLTPSADEIADRAGISARSLFRYFADVDGLVRAAVARQQEHLAPLFGLSARIDQPLEQRIGEFVTGRVRLLEAMGSVGEVARSARARQPVIATELARIRAALRRQVVDLFADALADLDDSERAAVEATLDVVTSWEAHHLLRHDQGLSRPAAAKAMTVAVRRLLAPGASA